jgi:heme A synthase
MSLEAADELQKREADRERFWERNKWVRRGAVAAVVAVILDALLGIADFVLKLLPSGG